MIDRKKLTDYELCILDGCGIDALLRYQKYMAEQHAERARRDTLTDKEWRRKREDDYLARCEREDDQRRRAAENTGSTIFKDDCV